MQMMTKEAVINLQQSTNHALNVGDYELIESLDRIACELSGVNKTERRLLDAPFFACGIKFYPLTVAKSIWYNEKLSELEVSENHQDAFMFWLLSLPNKEDALDEFKSVKGINKAMKRFARKLTCSADELSELFIKCTGIIESKNESGEDEEQQESTNYGGLIAVMLKEYGGTVGKWLWETPTETIAELFDQYAARCKAEQDAARGDAAKGGKAIAPRNDARIAGLAKFRARLNEIREIWSKVDG